MYTVRQVLSLLMFSVMFTVSACGSSVAQTTELPKPNKVHTPTVSVKQPANTMSQPIRLVIPSIGINAPVELVGIQSNGDLATPTQNRWENVGWYQLGTPPGALGSAVIDGHLDRPGGIPAVFWRLRSVRVGDDVQVTNSANKLLHFRVTRIAYYAADEAPLQDIFGNTGGKYLNLITCAGDWIPSKQQTTLRLVVYSTLV